MQKKKKTLCSKDRKKFKGLLLKFRDTLTQSLNSLTTANVSGTPREVSGEISGHPLHMADVASDNYEREFSMGLASGERETLREIDEALRRMENKSYGTCLGCDKQIAKKRLAAVPFAKYCIKCKSNEEDNK